MRIIIDMTAAQESFYRGIGRYMRGFAKGMIARRGNHSVFLLINATQMETAWELKKEFAPLLEQGHILEWHAPMGHEYGDTEQTAISRNAGKLYAYTVEKVDPDVVVYGRLETCWPYDSRCSVEALRGKTTQVSVVHDFMPYHDPEHFLPSPEFRKFYFDRLKLYSYMNGLLCNSGYTMKECKEIIPDIPSYTISSAADTEIYYKDDSRIHAEKTGEKFILYAGGSDEHKNIALLIDAYARLPHQLRKTYKLVIVCGKSEDAGRRLLAHLQESGVTPQEFVLFGYVSDEELHSLYSSCSLFVFPSLSEGFGLPPLEAMCCGAPVIVSNSTSLPEVVECDEALFDCRSIQSLADKMTSLLQDEEALARLRRHSVEQSRKFSWTGTAEKAWRFLEKLVPTARRAQPPVDMMSFCSSLELSSLSPEQKTHLVRALVRTLELEPAKIFIDITDMHKYDRHTGIQRVVHNVLDCLMDFAPEYGFEVVPVYLAEQGMMTASRWMQNAYQCRIGDPDKALSYSGHDVFLGLDWHCEMIGREQIFEDMRRSGVKVYFFVYDLLPVKLPQYFPDWLPEQFQKWLEVISRFDGIIADSRAVADDYAAWRKKNTKGAEKFHIAWSHPGCDFNTISSTKGLESDSAVVFHAMEQMPAVLMVSTVEPRKGYRQSLAAFELLWAEGQNIVLVIVGRRDERMEDFNEHLLNHPELGRRLFWLKGISDEYLAAVYRRALGVLVASEGEGFGLSIVEAANHGKPLLLRDIPVFREVAGRSAEYFSGTSPEELAHALRGWINRCVRGESPDLGNVLSVTWRECTKKILDILGVCRKPAPFCCEHGLFRGKGWNARNSHEYAQIAFSLYGAGLGKNADAAPAGRRMAVFGVLPPEETGIADYNAFTFFGHPDVDIFNGEEQVEKFYDVTADRSHGNVFPCYAYEKISPFYQTRIFVLGNSPHNVPYLQMALAEKHKSASWLYLHEANLVNLVYFYYNEDIKHIEQIIRHCYPEKNVNMTGVNDRISLISRLKEYNILCVRIVIKITKITNIIVNNGICEKNILFDVGNIPCYVHKAFLPVMDLRGTKRMADWDASVIRIGTFGLPSDESKQTNVVVEAVDLLRSRSGKNFRLVLAGYGTADYAAKHLDASHSFVDVHDSPDNATLCSMMRSVDVCVQLRPHPYGESSGIICQLAGMGQRVITTEGFVEGELARICCFVSSEVTVEKLAGAIFNELEQKSVEDFSLIESLSPRKLVSGLFALDPQIS